MAQPSGDREDEGVDGAAQEKRIIARQLTALIDHAFHNISFPEPIMRNQEQTDPCCDTVGRNPGTPRYSMSFSDALDAMKKGASIARIGWNANHCIQIQWPDAGSLMGAPYVYMLVARKPGHMERYRVPWVCSQTDMLADDWSVVSADPSKQ